MSLLNLASRAADDDKADVHQISWRFGCISSLGHIVIITYGGGNIYNGRGMVVCDCLKFGLYGSDQLRTG